MNAKSACAAAALNDIFSKLGWKNYNIYAFPSSKENTVIIQYRSQEAGCTRSVPCDPLGLGKWIRAKTHTPAPFRQLRSILDKKAEYKPEPLPDPPELPNLFT